MEAASGLGESSDDDSFWDAYLEKDFESVYENAHQEEIYSWNRTRIIEEGDHHTGEEAEAAD